LAFLPRGSNPAITKEHFLSPHFDRSTKVQALCLLGVGVVIALGRHHLSTAPARASTGIALIVLGIGHLGSNLRSMKWGEQSRTLSLSHACFALGDLLAICGGVLAALEQPATEYLMVSAVVAIVVGALMYHLASPRAVV
jgi:hypothetical protein